MNEERVLKFLKSYVGMLKDFKLPDSDFPLNTRTHMAAGGRITIHTADGRHVATVVVEGDNKSPRMPLGPAALAYAKLFVELTNGLKRESEEK